MLKKIIAIAILLVVVKTTGHSETLERVAFSKDENTVILLHFDESKGDFVRDYGIERDLYKMKNHKWINEGRFKHGIDFGQNDLKIKDKKLFDLTELTFELWINMKNINGKNQYIFYIGNSGKNGFGVLINEDGNLCLRLGGKNQIVTDSKPEANKWVHLALTVKENTTSLYLDGKEITVYKYGYLKPDDLLTLSSNSVFLNGSIDEVRLSNICRY